jgi:fructosamine-3-kinase
VSEREAIARQIEAATGRPFQVQREWSVGGGCINRAIVLSDGARDYFVKLNDADRLAMFEAEAEGLEALRGAGALRVPQPVYTGIVGDQGVLVMEYVALNGRFDAVAAGRGLAELHRCMGSRFGWHRDNTIGATPQPNTETTDWVSFWRDHRLGHQLALAARNGYGRGLCQEGERLMTHLQAIIGHGPMPSLLHGDLWGGNVGATEEGKPVIFDPAVYFGDRETDLAMTELFGGFGADFYAAYRESWPLPPEYALRKILYNLYHVLNHLNLFGGGYLAQARGMIDRLLASVR